MAAHRVALFGPPFAVLPFARCDSLLVFAWRVVRGRGGRERLREPPEAYRFSSVKVFTLSRAVLAGLGPYFSGRDGRWLAGHSAARSVLATLALRIPSIRGAFVSCLA